MWQFNGLLRTPCACLLCAFASVAVAQTVDNQADQVERLVRELNADSAEERDRAEQAILDLAPAETEKSDAFLQLLPEPQEGMPEEVRLRLERLRQIIETSQAEKAIGATKVTLAAEKMKLAEVFEKIFQQTGNRLSDHREQFGQEFAEDVVTLDINNQEFWPAVDQVLDQVGLDPYSYSGEESLAIVNRDEGTLGRTGRASYSGPFRVEATSIVAQRNLRNPAQERARVELEIAWEPRLRPIALSQAIEDISVTGDDGQPIATTSRSAVLDVEVQSGNHSTELMIPLALPPRSVTKIASFQGKISALVPGRIVTFEFDKLGQPPTEQQLGGVKVVVDGIRKNQGLWEVHMRVQVQSEEAGLESHRGWIFQNITYMVDKDGQEIDHAGFETTLQTDHEVGLAYFFELSDDEIGNYKWVYRTPAAIVQVPIVYDLKDLPLP